MKHPTPKTGFSLIELLVVISIIALLMGLSVVVASKLRESANVSTTRLILQSAASAETEYRATTGVSINHNTNPNGAIINGTYKDIERFVWAIQQVKNADQILQTKGDYLKDTDPTNGFLELVDAWGVPLRYRLASAPGDSDPLPYYHMPHIASAGIDGQWGTPGSEEAEDNLYSYEMN